MYIRRIATEVIQSAYPGKVDDQRICGLVSKTIDLISAGASNYTVRKIWQTGCDGRASVSAVTGCSQVNPAIGQRTHVDGVAVIQLQREHVDLIGRWAGGLNHTFQLSLSEVSRRAENRSRILGSSKHHFSSADVVQGAHLDLSTWIHVNGARTKVRI